MNLRIRTFILISLALLVSGTVFAQNRSRLPKLKYKEYKLKNGLRVVLHEDKSTPIVAVNLWYHVGSKNEVPGRTGFAHLFEHMMFNGSKNHDNDYFKPLEEAGANVNGSTNTDRTNYYELLPSNFLELALFLEADRMGNLLPAMTLDKLNNQRDVVKNERRLRYDNQPYGTAREKIQSLIYPKNHPYHWTTIGSLKDLSAASMEDVKSFFRKYYAPNNASLVIAGDFDEGQTRRWIEKYFGKIPRGVKIDRPNPASPKLNGEIRKTYEDAVRFPRRYMVWHVPAARTNDEAALDILASILSQGRGSRLRNKLVYEKQLVQNISAGNPTRELGGAFTIVATARPKQSLDEIEKEINLELERIKNTPPSKEEVSRAQTGYESSYVFRLQTVLGKADQMNGNNIFEGKPDTFQASLDRYLSVTPADVQRVAKKYLGNNRLVMSFVPGKSQGAPRNASANRPTSKAKKKEAKKIDYSANLPKPGKDPRFQLPQINKSKLSNGMEVWVVPQKELPIVSMNMVIKTGGTANPAGKEGLAQMTARLMDDGTNSLSAIEISNREQSLGIGINFFSGWDSTNAVVQTLTKHLDKTLALYSDVIQNPSFPSKELSTIKKLSLGGIRQQKTNPNAIANSAYSKLLYGKNHPYGRPLGGTESSIKGISREDLVKFYKTYYRPNNSTLIVTGDVDQSSLLPKLERAFAGWKPGRIPTGSVPTTGKFRKPGIYVVDKPGAAQSEIRIGQIGISRSNPDFIPVLVMNSILGGQFSARVNMNLREDKGYTYGAGTGFSYRRGSGPFTAGAAVQTAVTKESVQEFMKELNGIRGSIPVTKKELEYSKQSLIRRFPRTVETIGQISGQLANLAVYNLSDDFVNEYLAKIAQVSLSDVNRVANKYLDPKNMAILIVGDKKVIEPKLKELQSPGNSISYLDTEGNPVQTGSME